MKYSPLLYARALFECLEDQPKDQEGTIRRFRAYLMRNGDARLIGKILKAVERLAVHARGGRMVVVESARALPEKTVAALRAAFGKEDHLETAIRPELIAGVKMVIDGEWAIDATMKRKLQKLFL